MLHGGGKMVIAAGDRACGPGHFGRTIIDEGVEVMSCHFEADFDRSGRSVLAIRPLLWKNGWPVAGERLKSGTYEIESERRGYSLELAVDFVRMQHERQRFFGGDDNTPLKQIPEQTLDDVKSTWPEGNILVRIGDYMFRPHQKWTITPVAEAGGYLSNPYFKITISGTERALCATAEKELTTVPSFSGSDDQLWRIEQLTDGTYRIMPKRIPGEDKLNTTYVLYSAGDSTPTLAKYDFKSDNSKWNLKKVN
jgi:arabinan endo-1,5-alpha-L-arabinosidase